MSDKKQAKPFSTAHLKQLKSVSKAVRDESSEFRQSLQKLPREERDKLLGAGLWWAWAYELTVLQHQALLFWAMGIVDELRAALDGAGDKTQAFIDFATQYEPDDEWNKLFEGEAGETRKAIGASLLIALVRQFECVEREGCYLSDLVQRVGTGEDDSAFFRALHIDRTAVSCPTFGERISRAEIEGDSAFFANLARALKKPWQKKTPKANEEHKNLRVMLQATYETGQLQSLSMTEADELFIKELQVYADDGEDPVRSLQRFILRFKNNK